MSWTPLRPPTFAPSCRLSGTNCEPTPDPANWRRSRASFDSELKDYRDKTRDQVQRLRQEVQAAAAAVESFAGSISESEGNLESGLKRELNSLKQRAFSNDVQEIRGAIHASTSKIAASIEQMRSANQLAIAQLKDEIRLLHQEVQAARRSQTSDPALEGRQRINGRMEEFIRKNTPFSVLLVVVRNLEGLQNCYSASVIASALRGFQTRFQNLVPSSVIVDRWANNQFVAILNSTPGHAIDMSSVVVRGLSEPFLEQDQGGAHSVVFNPRAGVIEFRPGWDVAKLDAKVKELAEALSA